MLSRIFCLCTLIGTLLLPDSGLAQPSNGWIVWASNRSGGRHEIYLRKATDTSGTPLKLSTNGGTTATWAPTGKWVSYYHEATDSTYVVSPDGSTHKKLATGVPRFWLYDNSGLAVQEGHTVYLYNADTGAKVKTLWTKNEFARLNTSAVTKFTVNGLTPNKRWLVVSTDYYLSGATGDNGTYKHGWAPQLLDLQDKSKLYLFGLGCEGTTHPTTNDVYHVNGEDQPNYRFAKMAAADAPTRSSYTIFYDYPEADWGHEYFPRISTDGKWLTYGATSGCHDHDTCDYEIWIHQLGQGKTRTRFTNHSKNDQWPHMFVGTLSVPQSPAISLSKTSLAFSAQEGAGSPTSKTVSVTNSGGGTLAAVTTSVSYGSGSGWLTVAVSGSGNAQTLTNSVSSGGLTAGSYSATVSVAAAGAQDSPQSYQVTLTITEQPQPTIGLSATALAFSAVESGAPPASQTIEVGNNGSLTLAEVTTSVSYGAGDGWLSVTAGGAGNAQTLENSVALAGLAPGAYSATVSVRSEGATNSPRTYEVSLEVAPALTGELHLKINSGGGSAVAGWQSDAPYRQGGEPYTFDATVDLNGQQDAAPEEVYLTCIHRDHSYSIPVPDGSYLVRFHFFDHASEGRAFDYTIEGALVFDGFNITAEVGGAAYKALVKEVEVVVSDGDGLQIFGSQAEGNDVFESGIELISQRQDPADPGPGSDAAAPQHDGGLAADSGGPGTDQGGLQATGESRLDGGCSVSGAGSTMPLYGLILALFIACWRRR